MQIGENDLKITIEYGGFADKSASTKYYDIHWKKIKDNAVNREYKTKFSAGMIGKDDCIYHVETKLTITKINDVIE